MSEFLRTIDALRGGSDGKITLPLVVWAIIFGIILSWIIIIYKQRIVGAFVRAMIEAGATSPETAKTAEELGQDHNVSALSSFKKSAALHRMIYICGEEERAEDKKYRPETDENTKFYIPETQLKRAQDQYGGKGTSIWIIVAGVIGLLLLGVLITYFTI